MAATISSVVPAMAKAGDSTITITGSGFVESPEPKVYHRKHGATEWEAVDATRVTYVSATVVTVAIDDANTDDWDEGFNDVGVSVGGESAPEDDLAQALYFYVVGADDPDAVIVGPPDAIYIAGRYMGDLADAFEFSWEEEIRKIYTQHSTLPVKTYKGESTWQIQVPLAEVSLENIKDVLGSGASVEDLGSGRRRLTFGGGGSILTYSDVLVICPGSTGKKLAIGLYRCAISASGSVTFGKDENARLPLRIEVLADTSRAVDDQVGFFEEYTAS